MHDLIVVAVTALVVVGAFYSWKALAWQGKIMLKIFDKGYERGYKAALEDIKTGERS